MPNGQANLVDRVHSASAGSLGLVFATLGVEPLAWSRVVSVEHRAENQIGETLGIEIGGVVGGLAGYVIGNATIDGSLGKVVLVPGALGSMLVGGVVGAHVGQGWEPVTGSRPPLGFRGSALIQ